MTSSMAGYIGAFMTKVFRLGKKRVSEDHTDGEERETKEEEEIEEDEDTVMPTEETGSEDNEGGLIGDMEELDREATSFDESEDEVFENDKEGKVFDFCCFFLFVCACMSACVRACVCTNNAHACVFICLFCVTLFIFNIVTFMLQKYSYSCALIKLY